MNYVEENLQDIKNNIEIACKLANKNPKDITIIGVTKTISEDVMSLAQIAGVENFGENRVQELISKYDYFGKKVNWHCIGYLQTNKVKYIIDKVTLIHSLDRLNLAKELNKRAKRENIQMDVLVQVNIGNEETKSGVSYDKTFSLIDSIKAFENIKIKGLMAIAPYVTDPEENRLLFAKMNNLFLELNEKSKTNRNLEAKYLSMGMTNDYKVAIEEGSNMIRIGTALFGKREYS